MNAIVLDFETRSTVDLRRCGTSVYAQHESTEVLCMAWCELGGSVQLWEPGGDLSELFERIETGGLFWAHNVGFERQIWHWVCHKRLGWPDVPFDQWRCSSACCSALTLPRSLEGAGAALGLNIQKDKVGHKLMLKLCKPSGYSGYGEPVWKNDPTDLRRLGEYCVRDVQTQDCLTQLVHTVFFGSELKVWQLDQRINLRGIPIDVEGVERALRIVDLFESQCRERLQEITKGEVQTPKQTTALLSWLADSGTTLPNLQAATVREALAGDLPEDVRRVLQIRQGASKASTAKLKAMLDRCEDDGRIRGNLVYHGAATGRWAGSGIQIQNFPRGVLNAAEVELVHDLIPLASPRALDLMLDSPLNCISSSLRSFIRAPAGMKFLVCDFASIEARVLAWIANQDDLIDVFRSGGDVYKTTARHIYDKGPDDITKPERQIGKVAALGLGYSMGPKKFRLTCKLMAGVEIDLKFAKHVVRTYRESNDRISAFWRELNTTAIRTIETGHPHRVGRLWLTYERDWLRIQLPSGRHLHYHRPELVEVIAPWTDGYAGDLRLPAEAEPHLEACDVDWKEFRDGVFYGCKVPRAVLPKFVRLFPNARRSLTNMEPVYINQIEYSSMNSQSRKWGRTRTYGGKLCLAAGTVVLTDSGWKPIECVQLTDLVFDGHEWVSHCGVVFQGLRETIYMWGAYMTPDHRVLTTKGWKCASQLTGSVRQAVRLPDGNSLRRFERQEELLGSSMRLRSNSSETLERANPKERPEYPFVRMQSLGSYGPEPQYTRDVSTSGIRRLVVYVGQMQQPEASGIPQLWRTGHSRLQEMESVHRLLGGYGKFLQARIVTRSNQQRRQLHPNELPMGNTRTTVQQPAQFEAPNQRPNYLRNLPRFGDQPVDFVLPTPQRLARGSANPGARFVAPTYDIVNAGPRRRFVVRGDDGEPFISHNCENVTQAIARDFLVEAMLRLEQASYPIIATVHDEVICEVANDFGSLAEFEQIMSQVPAWGRGCPIACESYEAERYRK